jgi:hypothetical protein
MMVHIIECRDDARYEGLDGFISEFEVEVTYSMVLIEDHGVHLNV